MIKHQHMTIRPFPGFNHRVRVCMHNDSSRKGSDGGRLCSHGYLV